jgi:hypothetical protein
MSSLLGRLTKEQKDIVRGCGFGSILKLKCTSLPNPLVLYLAKHYDPKSNYVKLPDGGSFKIDAILVHQILGIPFGGKRVPYKASPRARSIILKDTNQSNQAAKIEYLRAMIDKEIGGDKFARVFLLVVFGIFLCPSSNFRVSHHFYEALSIVKEIQSYDWCSVVAEALQVGISSFHTNASKGNSSGKATLAGCTFILVVSTSPQITSPAHSFMYAKNINILPFFIGCIFRLPGN